MPAEVCLQMRRLVVDLATARDVTTVLYRLAQVVPGQTKSVDLLTVRTLARRPARQVPPLRSTRRRRRRGRAVSGRGQDRRRLRSDVQTRG